MDQADDPLEDRWPVLLDIPHELFDLFILGSVDDEFVGLFKVDVDFLRKVSVREESVADLDIAVVVIIGAFILSQEFSDVLVAL